MCSADKTFLWDVVELIFPRYPSFQEGISSWLQGSSLQQQRPGSIRTKRKGHLRKKYQNHVRMKWHHCTVLLREYSLRTKRSETQPLYREPVHFIHTHRINLKLIERWGVAALGDWRRMRGRVHWQHSLYRYLTNWFDTFSGTIWQVGNWIL